MRVSSIKPVNVYPKSDTGAGLTARERQNTSEHRNQIERENINQINTTIRGNSDGRVSFKGGAGTPLLHRIANFTSNNPLVAEAIFAIFITCGLRPISIMATAKDETDKEKCSYQAAKSISSGLVGLAMTTLVGTPIAAATKLANDRGAFNMPPEMRERSLGVVRQGVDALRNLSERFVSEGRDANLVQQIDMLIEGGKINLGIFANKGKNAQKIFTQEISEKAPEVLETVKSALKEQKILNNYAKTGKNVLDKFFQPVFMPLRAMITIALVPIILSKLGKHKPGSKPKEEEKPAQNPQVMLNYEVFQTKSEKELFGSFAEVTKHAN